MYIILSGVTTDAGKHREVPRKRHGGLVPGETGQGRTGRLSLQSQQPQAQSARLLPPPAGLSTQPPLPAAESSQWGGRRRSDRRQQQKKWLAAEWHNSRREAGLARSHLKLRPGLLLLRYCLPQRDHEVWPLGDTVPVVFLWYVFLVFSGQNLFVTHHCDTLSVAFLVCCWSNENKTVVIPREKKHNVQLITKVNKSKCKTM